MLKEATPARCCSHGFWAPGTPVGWDRELAGWSGRETGEGGHRPPAPAGGFLGGPHSPAALSLRPLCAGSTGQFRGEAGPAAVLGLGREGSLWTHRLLEDGTSCPHQSLRQAWSTGIWVLMELTLYFPGARYSGQCGGHALGSLSLPGWLWGGK